MYRSHLAAHRCNKFLLVPISFKNPASHAGLWFLPRQSLQPEHTMMRIICRHKNARALQLSCLCYTPTDLRLPTLPPKAIFHARLCRCTSDVVRLAFTCGSIVCFCCLIGSLVLIQTLYEIKNKIKLSRRSDTQRTFFGHMYFSATSKLCMHAAGSPPNQNEVEDADISLSAASLTEYEFTLILMLSSSPEPENKRWAW